MATKKISALSTGTTANATDKIPIERSGVNYYITPAMVSTYIGAGGGGAALLVRAHRTADQTVANSATDVINFSTVDYDPGSDVTTGASWHYTVPTTGWYDIRMERAQVHPFGTVWTVDTTILIDAYVGGSYVATLHYHTLLTTSVNYWPWLGGSLSLSLTAGNTLDLRFENTTGASRKLMANSTIAIYQVA